MQQSVIDLIIKDNKINGVVTNNLINIFCKTCVLTVGTFLNGAIFIGGLKLKGGRLGEVFSSFISLSSFYSSLHPHHLQQNYPIILPIRLSFLTHHLVIHLYLYQP